jgi:predicted methyltransferase
MELTIDDLTEKCEECNGTGDDKEPIPARGRQTRTISALSNPVEDGKCKYCYGTGRGKLTATWQVIKKFIEILKENPRLSVW